MKSRLIALAAVAAAVSALVLWGCEKKKQEEPKDTFGETGDYRQISQDKAREMMEKDDGHIIVDVRTQEEYESGHIPGAICIPNENISDRQLEELPDFDQIILVYCRSGRRSKEAASKLAGMGYKNVYEFGGIIDWTGETVLENEPEPEKQLTTLVFDSFDGGGPEYEISLDDPEIVSYTMKKKYYSDEHEQLTGAGYDVIFTFTGIKPGNTVMTVSAFSPIAPEPDRVYSVVVDEELNVKIELIEVEE